MGHHPPAGVGDGRRPRVWRDRFLAIRQFGLGYRDRERVRAAVLAGQPIGHPGLEAAVHEFAARVLGRRFRTLRRAEKLGWFNLAFGSAYAAFGLAMLIIGGPPGWRVEAVLGVINGTVLTVLGWYQAIQTPRRARRNAEHILRPSQDAAGSAQRGCPLRG